MEYERDEAKDEANQRKHGVPFSAVLRFDWDRVMHEPDTRRDYGEPRTLSIAPIDGRLHGRQEASASASSVCVRPTGER